MRDGTVHRHAKDAATSAAVGGDDGAVRVETLDNGAHVVIAERPGAERVRVQVGAVAGGINDPDGKEGIAHLLEHLAFEGSSQRTGDEQEVDRARMGNYWNAYTTPNQVVYYGVTPTKDASKAVGLLTEMYREPAFDSRNVNQEKAAVNNEMVYRASSAADQGWHIKNRLIWGDQPETDNVIGTKKTIGDVTGSDLRDFHERYYTGRNTVALIEGPPGSLPVDRLKRELSKLPAGSRVDNSDLGRTFVEGQALQLVKDEGSSTVELAVSLPFKMNDLAGGRATGVFMNELNTALGDRLRRVDHATYGAGARIEQGPDGTGALTVNTTVTRGNAKSALSRIVDTLKDATDGFGPKALDLAKDTMVSQVKMDESAEPTVTSEADEMFEKLLVSPGADKWPDIGFDDMDARAAARAIRKVNPADISAVGGSMIDLSNMKVLAIGNVGDGREIRAGLRDAGVNTRSIDKNPVDLSMYRQMGLKVASK